MNSPAKILASFILVSLITILCRHQAQAAGVQGSIGFDGTSGTATNDGNTHTVTFNNPLTAYARTGDYSGIPFGAPASFAPISWFGSGANAVLTSNNTPEWTVSVAGTTYQFSIIYLTNASIAGVGFTISGVGVAAISGAIMREPTNSSFSIVGLLDSQGNSSFLFFISQNSCANCGFRVSEGGSAFALLVLGLVGVGILRRKWCSACRGL